jgi:hypothetical protein
VIRLPVLNLAQNNTPARPGRWGLLLRGVQHASRQVFFWFRVFLLLPSIVHARPNAMLSERKPLGI